ncbi:MAG: hypothetical protein AB1626_00200 [Candidatus Micrarchaeota archaeon]
MASLRQLASTTKDVLHPFGHTETLLFYGLIAPSLRKFLRGKLVAVKNWIPKGPMPYLIKRGSREPPLSVKELCDAVTPEFLEVRRTIEHLDEAKPKLSAVQQKVWNYFLPRKLNDFFYATNGESPGKPIDRVFFDLDRGDKMSFSQAQEAAKAFVETIEDDSQFKSETGKLLQGGPFVAWTGSSFHVYLFFKKPRPNAVYEKLFQYSKNDALASYTGRWAAAVQKKVGFKVVGGHEKAPDAVVIDPSQTPSGKLCRVPLGSLHMADAKTVDGVSLPLETKALDEKKLADELRSYTPKRLLDELSQWEKRFPSQFRP